jgi:hypothetical protein
MMTHSQTSASWRQGRPIANAPNQRGIRNSVQEKDLEAQMSIVGREELRRILGDIDDVKVVEILALNPSLNDVEEAAAWLIGNRDVLAKDGRTLTSAANAIVELLAPDEEEPSPTN